VVLLDVNEGVLPRRASHLPDDERAEARNRDRRLFYVGASRAMQRLAVFADVARPSPFLETLDRGIWHFADEEAGEGGAAGGRQLNESLR